MRNKSFLRWTIDARVLEIVDSDEENERSYNNLKVRNFCII